MKKYIVTIICLGILSVFLCGCGKTKKEPTVLDSDSQTAGEENTGNQKENVRTELPEGYVLVTRFVDAGGETEMHDVSLCDYSIYYETIIYDAERGGHLYDVYVQEEGKNAQKLLSFGYDDGRTLMAMTAGEDALYFLYKSMAEGESSIYILEKRDKGLQIMYSVDATEEMEDIPGIYEMKVGLDGALYGLTAMGTVLCWDGAGAYQGQFTLPVNLTTAKGGEKLCFGLVNAGSAGIYAYWGGEDQESSNSIHLYDLKKWLEMEEAEQQSAAPLRIDFESAVSEAAVQVNSDMFVFSGYEDGLYLGDQRRLWQIDLEDGSLKTLLIWDNIYVTPGYVKEIQRREDGGFLLYVFDTLEQWNYWVSLEPVPASELPATHELVLGVAGSLEYSQSLTSKIDQVVLSYNRTHPYCRVTVREYAQSDITNFQTELLTGKGPDILLETESYFDMQTMMGKGIIEDLAPYLAESEEEVLPGIVKLATKDGKIPRIPLSFSVKVMVLPEGMGQKVMTPQEMAEFIGNSAYVDYLVYPTFLLYDILSGAEMEHYVNKEQKSCSFDSPEFVSLLESLAKLKEIEMIGARGERAEFFRSGQLNAVVEEMECLEDYICIREAFSGAGEVTGFPNSSGELRYPATPYDWMGINSATEYKEDAWSFIEFCLSYMSHSDDMADRFAVTKDKFEQQTQLEKEISYLIGWNFYNENWEGWQKVAPMTQEETDLLREMSEHLYFYEDNNLMNVIQEETWAFFSGDISAQTAAERIQNRASLIVAE